MTIQIVDKSVNRAESRRPLPELRKPKRFGCLFYLAVLAVLFYVAIGSYFAVRYLYGDEQTPTPVAEVVHESVEPEYPDLRQQVLEMLEDEARFCLVDPALAQSKIDSAVAFAADVKIDSAAVTNAFADLPKAKPFVDKPAVSVISVKHEPPVTWIELDVRQVDGRFASGLTRVDFEVGQGQSRFHRLAVAESVKNGKPPEVALLLDASGSTTGEPFRLAIRAAEAFIADHARRGRIKIWAFASDVKPITSWTSDVQQLVAALQTLRPDGGTALNKALSEAVADASRLDGATAIVLFTDGSDSFNNISLKSVLVAAKRRDMPVHVVALKTGETKPDILQQIATQTGGTIHLVDRADELVQKFRDVAAQLVTPVYRLAVIEPYDPEVPLHLSVAGLPPTQVAVPK